MLRILPIASGKGGVGKSVIAANLGIALARAGRAVVLVDLDLGASNLHTFLGIRNRHAGIGDLAIRRERSLTDLLVETRRERLWFIPGDGLIPGAANLEWFVKKRVLRELASLPADFVILDLGAGSSYNVVDFFLSAPDGLLVLKPEITSVLNAYSLLKTAAFRTILRAFPEKSPVRVEIARFAAARNEGGGRSFVDFARELAGAHPGEGEIALARLSALKPRYLLNMSRAEAEGESRLIEVGGQDPVLKAEKELGERLGSITARNLGIEAGFLGLLAEDPALPASLAARTPLVEIDPDSPFSRGIFELATKI